jgi:hypothetical protein
MGLLTFYAYDAMNLCRRFIKGVASGRPDWSRDADGMMDMIQSRKPISEDDARELLSIGLIAEETQVVGKLVTYPFWAVFLLIVSRHPSFDFFDFPWPLLLFWSLSLLGTILFAGSLRWAADRARNEVLGRLRIALEAEMGGEGDRSKARIEQLHQFIADVKREQRGAFRPFVHDPIITALATLLGGTGGFMLIEQLLPYK